ncbi:MAG: AraC family transcriptional regulator [Variovorax sp.]
MRRAVDGDGREAAAELRPRMFGVVPPNRESRWHLRGTPDIQLVYLHRSTIDRVAAEGFGLDPTRLEMTHGLGFADPLIEQLTMALLGASRQHDGSASGLYADGVAQLLALHLLQRYVARPPPQGFSLPGAGTVGVGARMRHVCDFIESALHEDLSLARLAAEAGVSAHAFSNAFTRAVGVTPHAHVLSRRIERAKLLLRASELPVIEVANQTGFASQSHLATVFKRAVGVTPLAYRRY